MAEIGKYSTESFIENKTKLNSLQMRAIQNMRKGVEQQQGEDVAISKSLFLGTKDQVTSYVNFINKIDVEDLPEVIRSQMEVVNQYGGVDNLFNLIDENQDGKVTLSEINNIAQASTDFLDDKIDEELSSSDLKAIFDNAMKAQGGKIEREGQTTRYTYSDGTQTEVRKDLKGNIRYKSKEIPTDDGRRVGEAYNYETKTSYQSVKDDKGRIISATIDAPGKNNDRSFTVEYDEKGNKRAIELKTAGTRSVSTYETSKGRTSRYTSVSYKIDGNIGHTKQQNLGDCWVLSGVNALSSTKKGAKLISDSIKKNTDGSVTVTLKGANRSYTFTPDEVAGHDYVDKNQTFSAGDLDMNLMEMAITKYREELIRTNPEAWENREASVSDPTTAGYVDEAFLYITGKQSQVIVPDNNPKDLTKVLSKIQKEEGRYATQFCLKEEDTSIGKGDEIISGHAYTIARVTDDTVYVINPWDSSREIPYPKDKFMQNCLEISILDMK